MTWKPISTAPKDDTLVDIWRPGDGRLANYRRIEISPDNVFYNPDECGVCYVRDATHWMPSPDAPDASGGQDTAIIAFVQGAQWWEHESRGATMCHGYRDIAEHEAERREKDGTLGKASK